jgi:hypothetical protein
VVLAAVVMVNVAGPVLAAVAELVHVVVAAVIVGAGAAGLVGLSAWRWCRWHKDAARAMSLLQGAVSPLHGVARAAQPQPPAQLTGLFGPRLTSAPRSIGNSGVSEEGLHPNPNAC